ncbi:hypothetical protein CO046_02845 [Candidatus Peregrinibacteria bacterium CG_4_9_14_0_2_um_filter_53_11]|nr:MAG: hypothetical protein CO046_02845 [Candidatus Peregrinibacteria bacterium CG_4_9_14_0_2_um_filter_53_11]
MFSISYVAAFLGGVLMLLPSCGPFIVPAFFAYSFKEKRQLVGMTLIFFLGFLLTFIPLGLSAAFLAKLLVFYGGQVYFTAGVVLIVLALLTLFGVSLPMPSRLRSADAPERHDILGVLIFGATFGLAAGGCTAPILGSVFTVAAVTGAGFHSVTLLMTFALGMIFPLLLAALYLDAAQIGAVRKFFFRAVWRFKLGGRLWAFPLTNILGALLFGLLGLLFLTSNVTAPLAALGTRLGLLDFFYRANEWIISVTSALPAWVELAFPLILGLFLVFLIYKAYAYHRSGKA